MKNNKIQSVTETIRHCGLDPQSPDSSAGDSCGSRNDGVDWNDGLIKNNGFKNIVKCCLIIVFVNAFWACKKYETQIEVYEVRIVSASITEIGTTTADFTIIISGFGSVGIRFWGYTQDVNFLWSDWESDWETRTYKTKVRIEGLWPGANYACQAYLQVDTLEVESEVVYFTTEIEQ